MSYKGGAVGQGLTDTFAVYRKARQLSSIPDNPRGTFVTRGAHVQGCRGSYYLVPTLVYRKRRHINFAVDFPLSIFNPHPHQQQPERRIHISLRSIWLELQYVSLCFAVLPKPSAGASEQEAKCYLRNVENSAHERSATSTTERPKAWQDHQEGNAKSDAFPSLASTCNR